MRLKLQARSCFEKCTPNSIMAYVVLDEEQQGNLWWQGRM
jgi:hypothetical protein